MKRKSPDEQLVIQLGASNVPVEKKIKIDVENNISRDDTLLVDKYKPKTVDELTRQDIAAQIIEWIQNRKDEPLLAKKSRQVLCIDGPPSSGKSTLAKICLESQGYTIETFNCDTVDKKLKTIYHAGISLVNAKVNGRVAILLENIEEWTHFSFGNFAKLLTLHLPKIYKLQEEKTKKAKPKKKSNKKAAIVEDKEEEKDIKDKDVENKKNEFGLTREYPFPLICPIICTYTPSKLGGRVKKGGKKSGFRTFIDACQHVKIDQFTDIALVSLLNKVCKNEKYEFPKDKMRDTFIALIKHCHNDPRRLLNHLQFLMSDTNKIQVEKFELNIQNGDIFSATKYLMKNANEIKAVEALEYSDRYSNLSNMMHINYMDGIIGRTTVQNVDSFLTSAAEFDHKDFQTLGIRDEIVIPTYLSKIKNWEPPVQVWNSTSKKDKEKSKPSKKMEHDIKKEEKNPNVPTFKPPVFYNFNESRIQHATNNVLKILPVQYVSNLLAKKSFTDQTLYLKTLYNVANLETCKKKIKNQYRLTDAKMDMLEKCLKD